MGTLRFVVAETHRHWHLADFERYELRRASDGRLVVPDRKTGFCVGNRYRWSTGVSRVARAARSTTSTARPTAPRAQVLEGLSPGWADDYKPRARGPVPRRDPRPAGRYVLVHRANPARRLREASYANNAASVLIALRRRGAERPPAVTVLARCPGTTRCGSSRAPPVSSTAMAFPQTRLRRLRRTGVLRDLVRETELDVRRFVYPMFVALGVDGREPIAAMPGIDRLSISAAVDEAGEAASLGVPAVLLFGIPAAKDAEGSGAWDDEGVVQLATRALKDAHPDLLVVTDVCLCEYTDHGHCGRCARTAWSTTTPASSCSPAPPSRRRAPARTRSRPAT